MTFSPRLGGLILLIRYMHILEINIKIKIRMPVPKHVHGAPKKSGHLKNKAERAIERQRHKRAMEICLYA